MTCSILPRPGRLFLVAALTTACGGRPANADRSPVTAPAGQDTVPRPQSYAGRSPHWGHLRTMVADYRIAYQADPSVRSREYDWAAAHFDRIVLDRGDSVSVPEYRRRNPDAALFRYAVLWTVVRPGQEPGEEGGVTYYAPMQRWYASNTAYTLETAFLHDAAVCPPPGPISEACRVAVKVWTQERWATNPGDPGAGAFHAARLAALTADVDGAFVDEHGSGDIADRLQSVALREYPQWADYQRDVVSFLRATRVALGAGRRLLLNTSEYRTSWDREMAGAAGGTHAEHLNSPVSAQMESRWLFVEALLADGAIVDLSSGGDLPPSYTAGNSANPTDRRRLWDLASYYLVVPIDPAALAYNSSPKWDRPYAERWVAAAEVAFGRPRSARSLLVKTSGATGGSAHVWAREFDRGWVLVRPADSDAARFDDATELTVPMPTGGPYRTLQADGRIGEPVAALQLRAGEAAILVR
ncbi:MAG: hypothetical protein NVS4B3_04880 [Gemmatimonadaceae bacterium]